MKTHRKGTQQTREGVRWEALGGFPGAVKGTEAELLTE